jgi:hypothetical protein
MQVHVHASFEDIRPTERDSFPQRITRENIFVGGSKQCHPNKKTTKKLKVC